jgi:dihydroxyacetone kinase-like predicted kinase
MHKYFLEFIITTYNTSEAAIKSSLTEFGEGLKINYCEDLQAKGKDYRINISTEDPTMIFDICSQFGRIKTVKINEEGR